MHSLQWDDAGGLDGYIFEFCNGTWDGSDCVAVNSNCYQQHANVSTACGGLDTGRYVFSTSGTVSGLHNAIDGDFSTFASTGILGQINITINYTKPAGSFNATWEVKDNGGQYNLTVPESCWDHDPVNLSFFVRSWDIPFDTWWYCLNDSGWQLLRYDSTKSDIYEEGVNWNISGVGWVNDTFALMTGANNWSNVTKTINSTVGAGMAWRVWANDTAGNSNYSSVFAYTSTGTPTTCGDVDSSLTMINDVSAAGACFDIIADDVVLDCSGHTIAYGQSSTGALIRGINVSGRNNITIKNCILSAPTTGSATNPSPAEAIYLDSTNNAHIENITQSARLYTYNSFTISGTINVTIINYTSNILGHTTNNIHIDSGSRNITINNSYLVDTALYSASSNLHIIGLGDTNDAADVSITATYMKRLTNNGCVVLNNGPDNVFFYNNTCYISDSSGGWGFQGINDAKSYNITIDNNWFNVPEGTIRSYGLTDSVITNNNIDHRTGLEPYDMMLGDSENVNITNNNVTQWWGSTIILSDVGTVASGHTNIRIINNTFHYKNSIIKTSSILNITDYTNVITQDNVFFLSGPGSVFYLENVTGLYSTNDSILVNPNLDAIQSNGSAHDNTFLNLSGLNISQVQYGPGNNNITTRWYVRGLVKNLTDDVISGASVNITNSTGYGNPSHYLTSGATGYTNTVILTHFYGNSTSNITYTPHNFTANYAGYSWNSTNSTITASGTVTIYLSKEVLYCWTEDTINKRIIIPAGCRYAWNIREVPFP